MAFVGLLFALASLYAPPSAARFYGFPVLVQPVRVQRVQVPQVRVRDDVVESAALGRAMRYRVLLPKNYDGSSRRYPALYLLHGLTGDFEDWTTRTNIAEYVRDLPFVVVMPDGENSWYTNAADNSGKFEDYIDVDLVNDVEKKYHVIRSRYGRAIAGLSMGGYGAMKLALKHPAQFVVAGSFSGALTPARDDELGKALGGREGERLKRIFGDMGTDRRKQEDVYAIAAAAKPAQTPYLYVDCGTNDGLLDSNREFAAILKKSGLAYEYHEVPGAHTWDYWDARIQAFLLVVKKKMQ
jgi:putative tributyrin esterase